MFCKNCGNEIDEGATFCMKCGFKAGNGKKYCAKCGERVEEGQGICVKCGNLLGEEAKEEKPVQEVKEQPKENDNEEYKKYAPAIKKVDLLGIINGICGLIAFLLIAFLPIFKIEKQIDKNNLSDLSYIKDADDFESFMKNDGEKIVRNFSLYDDFILGMNYLTDKDKVEDEEDLKDLLMNGFEEETEEDKQKGTTHSILAIASFAGIMIALIITAILLIKDVMLYFNETEEEKKLRYFKIKENAKIPALMMVNFGHTKSSTWGGLVLCFSMLVLAANIMFGCIIPIEELGKYAENSNAVNMINISGVSFWLFVAIAMFIISLVVDGIGNSNKKKIANEITKNELM